MHSVTRRLLIAAGFFLLPAIAAPAQVRFRVTVEEVLVDVVVTEGNRPLAGLSAADFVLLDGGAPREVRLVPLEDLPVSVLFVMDMSESVTRERRQLLASAARQFSGQLAGTDRCAVMTFSSQPVNSPMTSPAAPSCLRTRSPKRPSSAGRRSGTRCCSPRRSSRENRAGPSSSSSPTATTP